MLKRLETLEDSVEIIETAKELTYLVGFGVRRNLERILRTHPTEETRAMAAWALGFGGDERAAATLAEAFTDPAETVDVRGHAAEGLGHLLGYGAKAREFTPILVAGLNDPLPEIRFWCCFALGVFRNESALPELHKLVDDETDVPGWWPVGEEAQWAIAYIHGDSEFEPPRMKAWPDADHR